MKKILPAFFFACLLAGCASVQSARAPAPSISPETALAPGVAETPPPSRYYLDDGPPDLEGVDLAAIPDAVPRHETIRPAGNRPYRAFGKVYRPFAFPRPHRESGVASWYGRRYHGRPTASGEIYDMFKMTAAHPVLPIPSYARVTRADNGKSVVVRVNDRGPFLRGRIIDLSYAAAGKLDIVRAGVAQVTVESILPDAPSDESESVIVEPARDDNPIGAKRRMFFIQLGAFSDHLGAGRMLADFEKFAPEEFQHLGIIVFDSLSDLHRVGVGKYPTVDAARVAAESLCAAADLCGFVAPLP